MTSTLRASAGRTEHALLLSCQSGSYARFGSPPAATCSRTQGVTRPGSGDTRANTNAGVGRVFTRDVLVAKGAHLDGLDGPAL
jgi:hypothetical protein